MIDITTIGEILIDLTQSGRTEQGIPRFDANPGGAPANLAVAAARLGARTAFIGRVGNDSFGDYLKRCLAENGVDVRGMSVDEKARTTLAVVALDERGERTFSFYRDPSADVNLSMEHVPMELLGGTKVLHFGSVSLTAEPARTATLEAAKTAKASEELPLLTGCTDPEKGSARLTDQGVRLVLVTLGAEGAFYRFDGHTGHVPGVPCQVGDTNGSGDTFFGAALSQLVKLSSLDQLTVPELERILAFANKAASITTSRHGAIPAMPTLAEVLG